jgi:uncharacterized sporulation protein YeaH/YhbH (DUF444 family)
MTTFIYVDRRLSAKGKSADNRRRLLRRIKESIKASIPSSIDANNVSDGASKGGYVNSIKVARKRLNEPFFAYDSASGEHDVVLVGNDRFEKGDEFPLPPDGEGGSGSGKGSGAGQGGDSEDDFIINISRQEYFDVFFEDCELPNLEETHEKDMPQATSKPAGYQTSGSPAQLAVGRSYRNSKARQLALTRAPREELQELEAELEVLEETLSGNPLNAVASARYKEITARCEELRAKIAAVGAFEKLDLRYRKREKVLVKQADAVLIMMMDISGSMDEECKTIARRFFTLQYAFIKRKYPNTDLVFVAHTDQAWEMTEDEFFSTKKSGGTMVSEGYRLVHKIIKERYDPSVTNIYLSQASDGDNWDSDNPQLITELEDNGLLSKLRHAVYVQVGTRSEGSFFGGSTMWTTLTSVSNTTKKLNVIKVPSEDGVFAAFKKIYTKKGTEKKA